MADELQVAKDIVRLETNQKQTNNDVSRIDLNITKLTEIAGAIKELLAVHGNRLDSQDRYIETFMSNHDKDLEIVHERIDRTNTKVDDEADKILDALAVHRKESSDSNKEVVGKIDQLRKFYWMGVGGLTVLAFVIPIVLKYWVD